MLFTVTRSAPSALPRRVDRLDCDFVRQIVAAGIAALGREIIVFDHGRALARHILIERSAAGHVDELKTAADGQHRLVIGERPSHQLQFDGIAIGIGVPALRELRLAVTRRIDVHSARQEHAVKSVVDFPQRGGVVRQQRDQDGNSPKIGEHLHITLRHDPAARQLAGNRFLSLRGDADQRTFGHGNFSASYPYGMSHAGRSQRVCGPLPCKPRRRSGSDCVGDCRRIDRPARKGRPRPKPIWSTPESHPGWTTRMSADLDGLNLEPPILQLLAHYSPLPGRTSAIDGGTGSWNGRRPQNGIWCAGTVHLSPRRLIEQNTGQTPGVGANQVRGCYRLTQLGRRLVRKLSQVAATS